MKSSSVLIKKTKEPNQKIWAIVPAAGIGKRMESDTPKQYLKILDKTILEHTIERLLSVSNIEGVLVCVSRNDLNWQNLAIVKHKNVLSVYGGQERMHSVYNALNFLEKHLGKASASNTINPFVLVHDAVRPCVRGEDIKQLIKALENDNVGGLLATPAVDTLKRVNDYGRVIETLARENCWRAQTPQMFRSALLQKSIELLMNREQVASDEAAAMEAAGFSAKIVEGSQENIKLTLPSDLLLLEAILSRQINEAHTLETNL